MAEELNTICKHCGEQLHHEDIGCDLCLDCANEVLYAEMEDIYESESDSN